MGKLRESGTSDQVQTRRLLGSSASNVVAAVMVGKRYDYESPERQMINEFVGIDGEMDGIAVLFTGYIVNFVDILMYLTKIPSSTLKKMREVGFQLNQYLRREADEHYRKFDPNDIKDYCDAYLEEMNAKKNDASSTMSIRNMVLSAEAMFGAGSGTVKDAVEWTLLYMAIHQDVQKNVQKEIDEIIGSERRPTYADRALMPYTLAVINESLRYTSMIPINIPH